MNFSIVHLLTLVAIVQAAPAAQIPVWGLRRFFEDPTVPWNTHAIPGGALEKLGLSWSHHSSPRKAVEKRHVEPSLKEAWEPPAGQSPPEFDAGRDLEEMRRHYGDDSSWMDKGQAGPEFNSEPHDPVEGPGEVSLTNKWHAHPDPCPDPPKNWNPSVGKGASNLDEPGPEARHGCGSHITKRKAKPMRIARPGRSSG